MRLGPIFGLILAGILGLAALFTAFERIGLPKTAVESLFLASAFLLYAVLGIAARTVHVSSYFVAGRALSAPANGMAAAAAMAAPFVGLIGVLATHGSYGFAFLLGGAGGFALMAAGLAPYLRKLGCYTASDFFAFRYGRAARLATACALVVITVLFAGAVLRMGAVISSLILGVELSTAVLICMASIVFSAMLGGLRGASRTQIAQYALTTIGLIAPLALFSARQFGYPVPQLAYGAALEQLTAANRALFELGPPNAEGALPQFQSYFTYGAVNGLLLLLCAAAGAASLPQILSHSFTVANAREARRSMAWAMFFLMIVCITVPAYAVLASHAVHSEIIGRSLDGLQPWLYILGQAGLVQICGADAVGVDTVIAACDAAGFHPGTLRLRDLAIDPGALVLMLPELADMPYAASALAAAGVVAAMLASAGAAVVTCANGLSHDLCGRLSDPTLSAARRLTLARVFVFAFSGLAAYAAMHPVAPALAMIGWALSIAAAAFFPALVAGIWWKRASKAGGITAMLAGFAVTLFYIVVTSYFPQAGATVFGMTALLNPATERPMVDIAAVLADPTWWADVPASTGNPLAARIGWFNIPNVASGVFGLAIGTLVLIAVSFVTPRAPQRTLDAIDEMRKARGRAILSEPVV